MQTKVYKYPDKYIFHGVLLYDTHSEEGVVKHLGVPRDVVGLDILQDWIGDLQKAYDELHKETFK
jgi:hypothetical protein